MKRLLSVLVFGFLALGACSPEANHLIPKPNDQNEKVDTDGGTEVFDPQVDILFVVDDSGSMSTHQTNLIRNIDRFLAAFTKRANIDYHIGVVNTSMDGGWSGSPCCGRLMGTPTFVERSTPNLIQVLSRALRVGTNGSATEKVFDPIRAALSAPLVTGENAGFYRPNAHLAVVFITDAEDQSSMSAQDMFDFMLSLKGRKEKFIGYGVVVPTGVNNCSRDEGNPTKIESFLGMMPNAGKNVFSLCDPQFGDRISTIADDLVRFIGNVIYLSRPPIPETIQVSFGSQIIPQDYKKGWIFDPARNALILGDEIEWSVQPNGTKVNVYYEAATFPSGS
ncbi:MAG: VWA domain-containing protein [Bdellovibrionaceae bacterium]|nr:VWA domain-containing protein [Pseudobdellovibrionaceae bacterium]